MTKFISSNERVEAILDVDWSGTEIWILHFETDVPRQGHGRKALEEIRAANPGCRIIAYGVGHVESGSYRFWRRMAEDGLVDVLLDDNRSQV